MMVPLLALSLLAAAPQPLAPKSDAELEQLSLRELSLERNRAFARHGRAFHTPWVAAWFKAQPWYREDPAYTNDRLTPEDASYVRRVKGVENSIDTAALRVRRNTVFARHGRGFKSADLRAHFKKQPWYREDAAYSDARLTADDKIEIELIQKLEAQAGAVPHLAAWKPGKTLTSKQLAGADMEALFTLYVKMTQRLKLAGYGSVNCEFVEAIYEIPRLCEDLKSAATTRASLSAADRKTLGAVERVLATRVARENLETAEHDTGPGGPTALCWEVCSDDMGEFDAKKCATCERREAKDAKKRLRLAKENLGKVKKGKHPIGSKLFDEVASVFMHAAA